MCIQIISASMHTFQKDHGVKTRRSTTGRSAFLLTVPASDIQRRSIVLVAFSLRLVRPRRLFCWREGGFQSRRRRWWCGHNDRLHAGRVDGGPTRLTPTVRRALDFGAPDPRDGAVGAGTLRFACWVGVGCWCYPGPRKKKYRCQPGGLGGCTA